MREVITATPGNAWRDWAEAFARKEMEVNLQAQPSYREYAGSYESENTYYHHQPEPIVGGLAIDWSTSGIKIDGTVSTDQIACMILALATLFFSIMSISLFRNLHAIKALVVKVVQLVGIVLAATLRFPLHVINFIELLCEGCKKNSLDAAYLERRDQDVRSAERLQCEREEDARRQARDQRHQDDINKIKKDCAREVGGAAEAIRHRQTKTRFMEERLAADKKHDIDIAKLTSEKDKLERLAATRLKRIKNLGASSSGPLMTKVEGLEAQLNGVKYEMQLKLSDMEANHATERAEWQAEKLALKLAASRKSRNSNERDGKEQARLIDVAQSDMHYGFPLAKENFEQRLKAMQDEKDELAKANRGLKDLELDRTKELETLQRLVLGLQTQLTNLQSEATGVQTRVTGLKNEKSTLESRLTTSQAEKVTLQGQVTILQNEKTFLDGQMTTLQHKLDHLQVEAEKAYETRKVELAQTHANSLERLLKQFKGSKDKLDKQHTNEMVLLNNDVVRLKKSLNEKDHKITELKATEKQFEDEMESDEKEIKQLKAEITTLKKQVQELTPKRSLSPSGRALSPKEECNRLRKKVAGLEQNIEWYQKEKKDEEKAKDQIEKELKWEREERIQLKKKVQLTEKSVESLKADVQAEVAAKIKVENDAKRDKGNWQGMINSQGKKIKDLEEKLEVLENRMV